MKALSDIASVGSGVYAKPRHTGDVYYIQARDITKMYQFADHLEPLLVADGKIDKHFLLPGDILIAAKGKNHYAIEYKGFPGPAVASTIFFVVRIKDKQCLLPGFVRSYINLPHVQKTLAGSAQGSFVPVISKAEIESMQIPVPSIEKQNAIIKIHELREREMELGDQIRSLRSRQIELELLNAIFKII